MCRIVNVGKYLCIALVLATPLIMQAVNRERNTDSSVIQVVDAKTSFLHAETKIKEEDKDTRYAASSVAQYDLEPYDLAGSSSSKGRLLVQSDVRTEVRDPIWADETETAIKQAAAQIPFADPAATIVICGSTVCHLSGRLMPTLSDTQNDVVIDFFKYERMAIDDVSANILPMQYDFDQNLKKETLQSYLRE